MSVLIHALDPFPLAKPFPFNAADGFPSVEIPHTGAAASPGSRGSPRPQISHDQARALLQLARLVYEAPEEIAEIIRQPAWGINPERSFQFLSGKNTQAFLLQRGGETFLSFRGTETENFWDWRVDADVETCIDRVLGEAAGRVHRGFSRALDAIWPELLNHLQTWGREHPLRLWITGHSLGAALAELAAIRLTHAQVQGVVSGLCTFGKPKIGDASYAGFFSQHLRDRAWYFVNHLDLISRIPPASWGFAPTGRLRFIDADHQLQEHQETLDEIGDSLASYIELAARFFRHQKVARLARLLEKPHGGVLWAGIGAVLSQVPQTLLDSVRMLIPPHMLDHFPSEYLKVFSREAILR